MLHLLDLRIVVLLGKAAAKAWELIGVDTPPIHPPHPARSRKALRAPPSARLRPSAAPNVASLRGLRRLGGTVPT